MNRSAPSLETRVARLEGVETDRANAWVELKHEVAHERGAIVRELAGVRTSLSNGLGGLNTRLDAHALKLDEVGKKVDGLLREVEGEMRPRLDTLRDDVESSSEHLLEQVKTEAEKIENVLVFVGKLKAEREARLRDRREAETRNKRLVRRAVSAAVIAFAVGIGGGIAAAILNHWGIAAAHTAEEHSP